MTTLRWFGLVALGCLIGAAALEAQPRPGYRDFPLGDSVASIAGRAGLSASDSRIVHQRPAVLVDLAWRLPYRLNDDLADPVRTIVFSFYNDQLFKIVVDYDVQRTAGLNDSDIVQSISATFGQPLTARARLAGGTLSSNGEEAGLIVARWGDADHAIVLYRSSYQREFSLVVSSSRLDGLAARAQAEALRLDERDAPQRAIERDKAEAAAARAAEDSARTANRAAFRP